MLICIYNLTDDETFSLWMVLTLFLQLIQSNIDLIIISDRLCISALTFCAVLAIGISVKGHIGTSLL